MPNAKLTQVVRALNNAIAYFGGVPQTVKSDNMKQWVTKSCRYEPVFTDIFIDEPTLADAIMDRLSASAHRIALTDKSLRKRKNH